MYSTYVQLLHRFLFYIISVLGVMKTFKFALLK